jgi:hypothetical protein
LAAVGILGPGRVEVDEAVGLDPGAGLARQVGEAGRCAQSCASSTPTGPRGRANVAAGGVGQTGVPGNVALALARAGRDAEALARYEQVLQDCLRVLGPDHELTRYTAGKLAEARERHRPRPG